MENIKRAPWEMMFADDVLLCSSTREELEKRLEIRIKALEEKGMKIIRKKTEYSYALGEEENKRGT